ncbi:unnamed protein product [Cuscuta campestris]|uniref:Uncharacterized protein n=1 Tax=Cuscuta campestris TaxID=132261 RepID=A0A484KWF7_9ASTE|nr:unnamed protein product [Cuscuta campestris]
MESCTSYECLQIHSYLPEQRYEVSLDAQNWLVMSKGATRIIAKSFERKVGLNGYRWAAVSERYKEFYWREFHKNSERLKGQGNAKVHESIIAGWKQMWDEEKYLALC